MATARFDRGSLARPLEGTLYEAVVARTHRDGDALKYPTGPEFRDLDELDKIVAQLPGLPLIAGYTSTLNHPNALLKYGGQGRVIGKVVAARRDGNEAIASVMVADADALEQIREGISEISLGYECELDDRRMQRETHLDHISIVPRGRCTGPGGKCALRVDCAEDGTVATCGCGGLAPKIDAIVSPLEPVLATLAEPAPACACTILANSQDVDHPGIHMADSNENKDQAELQKKLDQATADLKAANVRADAAELDRDNARKDAEKLARDIDAAKTRADQAVADAEKAKLDAAAEVTAAKKQAKLDADEAFNAEMGERIALLAQVTEVVGKDNVKVTDSPRALKRALIVKVDGADVPADKQENDSYIDGMYAGAIKRAAIATESRVALRETTQQMRVDGETAATEKKTAAEREAEAKRAAAERAAAQWQRKPAN